MERFAKDCTKLDAGGLTGIRGGKSDAVSEDREEGGEEGEEDESKSLQ